MQLAPQWDEDAGWNEYDHEDLIVRFEPRYIDRHMLHEEISAATDPRRRAVSRKHRSSLRPSTIHGSIA